jgi:4-coumarate--CoA ligase
MTHQCNACGVSVLIGVQPMASKMLGLLQENSSIRRMILIGGFHDGFASFEDLLSDSGDLFNENINVSSSVTAF